MTIASNYRFVLCFENDLYPGYVTEKIFDAWATGAVPLWWGIDSQQTLNADAFLNLNDFSTIQFFVDSVMELEQNRENISVISSHPLLHADPNGFKTAIDEIRSLIT